MTIAHQMIDYGADFVVGNGTHWVQNTEVYKGKLIVYSLGNFIFDQLDYDGRIALNLAVNVKAPYNSNIGQWLKFAPQCQASPSSCLALARSSGLKRYYLTYKFNAIGSYGGDGLVATRATPQQQSDIESLANWQSTAESLASHK